MKKISRNLVPYLLFSVSISANASQLEDRIETVYQAHNNVGQIECKAPALRHLNSEFIQGDSITTKMTIKDLDFQVKIDQELKVVLSAQGLDVSGYLDKASRLHFDYINQDESEKAIISEYKLDDMKCKVLIKEDKPLVLNTQKVHINVHPHQGYDPKGYTTEKVNEYFADESIESVVLLDKMRNKLNVPTFIRDTAKFMNRGYFSTPVVNITEDIPMIISPSGHNMFDIKNNDLDVIYTGGNLNYCVYNNTTNLVESFLQTSEGGQLNINYDLDAMVAQKTTRFSSGFFSKLKFSSNLWGSKVGFSVRKKFNKSPKFANKYTKAHKEAVANETIAKMPNFYNKVTYIHNFNDSETVEEFEGTGEGIYTINIYYTNL